MKSILYILEDGRFGGMNKMTADVLSKVSRCGFRTSLLVGKKDSRFFTDYLVDRNIAYSLLSISILSKNKLTLLRYAITFPLDILNIFRHIRKTSPNLVYCNGSQQIKGVIAATLAGKNVIWHMHDTYQPRFLLAVFHLVRSLCSVKWFVASCQRTVNFYDLDTPFTLVSYPPIDTSVFKPNYPWSALDSEKTIKILTIANINTDKGLDTLVQTAAELRKSHRKFTFEVIGLGAERSNSTFNQILNLIELYGLENIDFTGQKTDIRASLAEADFYLCTSRNESGPLSVFEALAMGIPVVSTDVGDLGRLFYKYGYGRVLPVGDQFALADEIISLLEDPKKLNQRAAIGRMIAKQELDIELCVSRQAVFYDKVLSE